MVELNAKNLKALFWESIQDIKNGDLDPAEADSIATQGREILRTVKVQLSISRQAKRDVPTELIDFSESTSRNQS